MIKKHIFHIAISILYMLFIYMIIQAVFMFSGQIEIADIRENMMFKSLRAIFFILALGMSFICLIKFLYDVNRRNFYRLVITGFPIGISLIYIIYMSLSIVFQN